MATVYPCLRYREAATMIKWLADAFGLTEGAVYTGDDGAVSHADLRWHGGGVMLGSYRDGAGSCASAPGAGAVYLVVTDVDAHHARAVAAGAEILLAPADTDYGSREYTARDPEGNIWNFGTYEPA
jgi:uncharacterized glyoxalase superfamily protein PhnB